MAKVDDTLTQALLEQRKWNKRTRKHKVPLYPLGVERDYRRELVEMVRYVRLLLNDRLMPRIADLKAQANAEIRNDSFVEEMNTLINGIRFSVFNRYPANRRQQMAIRSGEQTNNFQKRQFATKVLVPNNLPIPVVEPWISPFLESYSYVNTRLIESIPDKYLDNVQAIVNEGVLGGLQTSDIKAQVQAQFGVNERRAQLIARDQVSKLNGQLNRTRQERAGFNKYKWQTAGDASVRSTHARNQGKIFSWDEPPDETGHPGEDYNCRCWAEPAFDDDVESQEDS